jgi:hypothetical protein
MEEGVGDPRELVSPLQESPRLLCFSPYTPSFGQKFDNSFKKRQNYVRNTPHFLIT